MKAVLNKGQLIKQVCGWIVLACSLQMFIFFVQPFIFTECFWPDEALYVWYAKQICLNPAFLFSGEVISRHPPLFALILSLGYSFFPSIQACQVMALIFSILALLAIYILGRMLAGPFVGLLAVSLLGQSYIFFSNATKVLIDIPLMLFFMIFLIVALTPRERLKSKDILLGVIGGLIILLKWSGFLIIPILLLVYSLRLESLSVSKPSGRRILAPLLILGAVILVLSANQIDHFGRISHYQDRMFKPSLSNMKTYLWYAPGYLNSLLFCSFLFMGIYHAIRTRSKTKIFIFIWFVLSFFALVFVPDADGRYALNFLPSLILLTAIGMDAVLNIFFTTRWMLSVSRFLILVFIFNAGVSEYPKWYNKLKKQERSYLGFAETGIWIKSRFRPDSWVIASSYRQIRYHADINVPSAQRVYAYWGKDDLKKFLSHPGHIILEIDNWGSQGSLRIDPGNPVLINFLKSKGFKLTGTFGNAVYYYGKDRNDQYVSPMIWVFEREPLQ